MCDNTVERAYKQNKSAQQKQYRDREVDSFAELREAIHEADDQEPPRTRHETLLKAAQLIKQLNLNLMNLKLHQQLRMQKSSRNDEYCMMTHAQIPAMSLHWNSDVKSVGTRRTTEIVPQSTPRDFCIGVRSGVYDSAVLEGAQDHTNIISRCNDNLSQNTQYTSVGPPLNQSRISYDMYSY